MRHGVLYNGKKTINFQIQKMKSNICEKIWKKCCGD